MIKDQIITNIDVDINNVGFKIKTEIPNTPENQEEMDKLEQDFKDSKIGFIITDVHFRGGGNKIMATYDVMMDHALLSPAIVETLGERLLKPTVPTVPKFVLTEIEEHSTTISFKGEISKKDVEKLDVNLLKMVFCEESVKMLLSVHTKLIPTHSENALKQTKKLAIHLIHDPENPIATEDNIDQLTLILVKNGYKVSLSQGSSVLYAEKVSWYWKHDNRLF
jgi:hypothetical protein